MKTASHISILATLVLLTMAGDAVAQDRGDRSFTEKYSLILQRNIFAKNRRTSDNRPAPPPSADQPKPQEAYMLTGVVKREDGRGYTAFIEDARTGTTNKYQVGASILDGRVTVVDFDSIQYVHNGKPVRVTVGMNLEGGMGTRIAEASSSSSYGSSDGGRSDRRDDRSSRDSRYGSSSSGGSSTSSSSSIGSSSGGSGSSGLSAAEIEARMRERRAREGR